MNDTCMYSVNSLNQLISDMCNNQTKTYVSQSEYDEFRREFVFEKLKVKRFGQAFCEKYNIDSFVLRNLSDETAKHQIETLGYIK